MFETILYKFKMFLEEYSVHHQPLVDKTVIKYTVLQYDVIDAELDFNEEEYKEIIRSLDEELYNHAQDTRCEVDIIKTRLVYKNFRQEEFRMHLFALEPHIIICTLDVDN